MELGTAQKGKGESNTTELNVLGKSVQLGDESILTDLMQTNPTSSDIQVIKPSVLKPTIPEVKGIFPICP